MAAADEPFRSLVQLGFTRAEAEVYVALLGGDAMTGYRVAQVLNRPAANIYKLLEALEAKGAVLVDDGESRLFRAVPPDEVLGTLARSFERARRAAAAALAERSARDADDRVYQLRTARQAFERCRNMLAGAREVVLLDVFPRPLDEIRAHVEDATRRGVRTAIKLYAQSTVEVSERVVLPTGPEIVERWPGDWVNLVVDGSEHLIAFLDREGDGLHQAIWSASPYLSWVYHCALSSEIVLSAVEERVHAGGSLADVKRILAKLEPLETREAPGYRALVERFARERTGRCAPE